MSATRALAVLGLAVAAVAVPPISRAAEMRHQVWGRWSGGSYSNDATQQFSHCTAAVPYRSGITMFVTLNRSFGWSLGFSDAAWNLTPGEGIPIAISFDGGAPWNGTAHPLNKILVEVPMDPNSALITAFRASVGMTAYAAGQTFIFKLDGTSQLMPGLARCVQTELAIERGETPPAFSTAGATAQQVPQSPPLAQGGNAELELAATRIASNLLLQAQLPNARLLSRAETPESVRRLGVAWKSDAGVGAVELLAQSAAKDSQQVASQLIDSDAAACKGDVASSRSSELIDNTIVTKAVTICKSSSGSGTIRYFVRPP